VALLGACDVIHDSGSMAKIEHFTAFCEQFVLYLPQKGKKKRHSGTNNIT